MNEGGDNGAMDNEADLENKTFYLDTDAVLCLQTVFVIITPESWAVPWILQMVD